jgi:hypothetical protein
VYAIGGLRGATSGAVTNTATINLDAALLGAITATASLDANLQFRPEAPTIASHSKTKTNITLNITPSSEGYPGRWYRRASTTADWFLDGQTTAASTAYTYYYLSANTNYKLATAHYNTTGRIQSLFDSTQVTTLASVRRVSGRLVG